MKLSAEMIVEIGLLLLMSQMNEACLDLLVRSFNQIFTPVIETSEDRVHKSHRVDDLTNYYKRDENGNFVLRDEKWLSANPFVKGVNSRGTKTRRKYKPTGRSLFEHLNMEARALPDEEDDIDIEYQRANYTGLEDYGSSTNQSNVTTPDENIASFEKSMPDKDDAEALRTNARKVLIAPEDYEYEYDHSETDDDLHPYGREPRHYKPGDRPILDFLIKLLEMFQVSLAKTPRNDHYRKSTFQARSSNESDQSDHEAKL